MNDRPKNEGPEVAASEPSEPFAPHQNEQENSMMTHDTSPIDRLRSAAAEVGPELLSHCDVKALLDLIRGALASDSAFGQAMRQRAADRIAEPPAVDTSRQW